MSGLAIFTLVHVLISLVGIFAGFVAIRGMLASERLETWTAIFLGATLLTTVTGFFFPFVKVTPAIIFGVLSIIVLTPTFFALYARNLAGRWRSVYVVGALIALYLNTFVLIVQSFLKIPFFNAFAPTGTEPPFAVAQGALLLLMIFLGYLALRRFRPS